MSDWQLDRLPGDVRLEAENAAQREGLPLHRWLGKVIRDTCAEEGVALSRELSRGTANGATQRRPISTIAAAPAAREPIRPAPQARADEPPRPLEHSPEGSPLVNGGNGAPRALNGLAAQHPAATPAAEAAPSEPPPHSEAPRTNGRPAPNGADEVPDYPNLTPRRAMPSPTPEPATMPPPKLSAVDAKPLGRPPMPTMPPPPPAPTPSRVATEPRAFSTRPRPEPAVPPAPPAPSPAPRADDPIAALARLVRGLQRNELSPIGEARLYLKLMTEHMASIGDLTVATGRTKEQIARSLRLLGLSDRLRDLIDRGALSREQAFALLDSENPDATNPVVPPSAMGQYPQ